MRSVYATTYRMVGWMNELEQLLEQTIRRHVRADGRVVSVATRPMRERERGYSGAHMERHEVGYRDAHGAIYRASLVTKDASLTERRVLERLAAQGQCVPYSYTLDLTTNRSALVCQQDLDGDALDGSSSVGTVWQVARCLARIHAANLGRADELAWLPRAAQAYVEDVILADFRQQLALTVEHPAFAAEYGETARRMEEVTQPFLVVMGTLWTEGDSLTLIHADLMDDHVLIHAGRPYLIDWGQARYGSLYLDLPNIFTPDTVLLYQDALAELGHDIPTEEFMRRYREAGRYPGFKYMGFLLSLWRAGQLDSLHGSLLDQLLHGT